MGNCVGGKGSKKDPTKLTEEEIKLLLDNTKLNRAQISALYHNFLKECPSGKLTKKDFVKLFKEVHPSENKKEKADKFCEYVFKVIDRDNLGYISFQDFVLCFSLTSYGDFKQKCEFAFRLYDLDKDGKISKKEMTQVLEALYDLSGITDRKGDRAPAKKVEEIIKKLNQAPAPAPAAEPAPAPAPEAVPAPATEAEPAAVAESAPTESAPAVDAPSKDKKAKQGKDKKSKPEKPAKEAKPKPAKLPDFITKEQFIEACNTDESIKKLFVDSIFASQSEAAIEVAEVIALGEASPNLIVETNTVIDSDQNQDVVTTTTKVLSDESAASTTVVNHSEVIISQHSVPEEVTLAPLNSDESAAVPAPTEITSLADLTADLNNQVNSVVEEINNTIQVDATSNETQLEAEPSSEKQSAAPEGAAAPASQVSNVEDKPVEGPK